MVEARPAFTGRVASGTGSDIKSLGLGALVRMVLGRIAFGSFFLFMVTPPA
jgi:hypothetical protein